MNTFDYRTSLRRKKKKELSWWLSSGESACNAGDIRLIRGSGSSPGEGNGNPLQYSCLGNPMDRDLTGCSPWVCKSQI